MRTPLEEMHTCANMGQRRPKETPGLLYRGVLVPPHEHVWKDNLLDKCYHRYTCEICPATHTVDSGD